MSNFVTFKEVTIAFVFHCARLSPEKRALEIYNFYLRADLQLVDFWTELDDLRFRWQMECCRFVIIGKLIPAGTGLARYRNIRVEPTEEAKAAVYAAYDEYDFTPFESQGSGEAVRLDEFEVPR